MDWLIRQADVADVEALALVGAATFLETFAEFHTGAEIIAHCRKEHSVAAYSLLLRHDTDAWLVETAATAAPIGYAMLTPADLPGSEAGDLELKRIYTLSRFHGSGLGTELMRRVVACTEKRGARRLLLDVYSRNSRAIAFYRKHGFEKIADQRFFVGDTGYDDLVFAKRLASAQMPRREVAR